MVVEGPGSPDFFRIFPNFYIFDTWGEWGDTRKVGVMALAPPLPPKNYMRLWYIMHIHNSLIFCK